MRSAPLATFASEENRMADDVVQQLSRQFPYPVVLIAEKRPGVLAGLRQLVAVVALHVDRCAAQVTICNELAQSPGRMTELIVVSGGDS